MLSQYLTRIMRSVERPVQAGFVFEDEGIAAVYAREGDKSVVTRSTGAAGEVFAGLTLSRNGPPTHFPLIQEIVLLKGETSLQLPRAPIAGQLTVKADGERLDIVTTGTPGATEVKITDKQLDFAATLAEDKDVLVYVQLLYIPSVVEARTIRGDEPVGGRPSNSRGRIGLLVEGDVSTTYFDASADWNGDNLTVRLGADGMLTTSGTGTVIPGAVILNAPSAAAPFLTVALQA